MKRAINEFARGRLDEEAADRRHRDSMRSAEIKEGMRAFAEKTSAEVLMAREIIDALILRSGQRPRLEGWSRTRPSRRRARARPSG